MLRFVGHRLLTLIPLIFLIMLGVFVLMDLAPTDAATTIAGDSATPERIAEIRAQLGLDRPVLERFAEYAGGLLQGDLGKSPISGQSVFNSIAQRLPVTVSLVVLASFFSVLFGCAAGVVAAVYRNSIVDRLVNGASALLMALPAFVVGIFLVLAFSLEIPIFPATGYATISDGIGQWLLYSTLPALALAGIPAAQIARQTRGALIDVLEEDYIRTARAKGLTKKTLIGKHAAKNAAIPVVTVLGALIGTMIGGAVIIERVFAIPGIGSLSVESVFTRDLPMLQGVVLVSAIAVILLNLLVDISYGYFNPQVRAR